MKARLFFVLERAPAGALRAPGAAGAQPPIRAPGAPAAPVGPFSSEAPEPTLFHLLTINLITLTEMYLTSCSQLITFF